MRRMSQKKNKLDNDTECVDVLELDTDIKSVREKATDRFVESIIKDETEKRWSEEEDRAEALRKKKVEE